MPDLHAQKILILDFGSQYTQLIARRVREAGVFSEIHDCDLAAAAIREFDPSGIILSGGPQSVAAADAAQIPDLVFELGVPVLGICYGMQAMATRFGGRVAGSELREFGPARIRLTGNCALLQDIQDQVDEQGRSLLDVWMSHGDQVETLPPQFEAVAATDSCPIAAMAHREQPWYGMQFHPEVTHTSQGQAIIRRFVLSLCGCEELWTPANIIAEAIAEVRTKVGRDRVLLGLSGGVDSSVVAALLQRAIGSQLTCVFVDNGLLRKDEGDQVMQRFVDQLGVKVVRSNAEQLFLERLAGVRDPEHKRRIIGSTFIEVFDREAARIEDVKWLAQGTIYPDVIESAGADTGKAQVIKSHHNVGGLPTGMTLQLLEPLRELFKDEVRRIGVELGLSRDMVYRHPFPGPGLGVRILGEVKKEYADLLREADAIFLEELRAAGYYQRTSQAFAVFLPVKSVGVVGDGRRYEYVIALRAVETVDFMTAHWAHLPHQLLERVSSRIINEISGISRVTYDISSKPPATIEWE